MCMLLNKNIPQSLCNKDYPHYSTGIIIRFRNAWINGNQPATLTNKQTKDVTPLGQLPGQVREIIMFMCPTARKLPPLIAEWCDTN